MTVLAGNVRTALYTLLKAFPIISNCFGQPALIFKSENFRRSNEKTDDSFEGKEVALWRSQILKTLDLSR